MEYSIESGTRGKLLTRIKDDEYDISDWTLRLTKVFPETACGINPNALLVNPGKFDPNSLGVQLTKEGYALFTDSEFFDREAEYIFAVMFNDVILS